MFQYVVESDTGKIREVNEDSVAVLKRPDGLLLAIVADGMGGHKAGDVASKMTVDQLSRYFLDDEAKAFSTLDNKKRWLSERIQTINRLVFDHSMANLECKGMGTTLVAALIEGDEGILCHIGDSRAYLINGGIEQITRDHSYVNVLVDSGEISQEEAEEHPKKNWIVRALGTEASIERELIHFSFMTAPYLLICSDGLSNKIPKEELASIVRSTAPLSQKGQELVTLANDLGGEDNISFILLSSMDKEV
ncbi:protein phosphatase 2C [Planococcus antarcticus DSM 14505]|uniref:Protein phosphatase n=1 Tax=Planococcus antarcticus DSM 14505 TaxID=1185653 RepID=A0A1C7DG36_9BACL|nr:Stp1/IreP family PP2C-type Ser/Thr phosphatase [Planococcus antarcticus]ANU10510.1 protein phosphatase [Planococcus antarcticus DSM 14505]EIM07749.1 protein phosphatase 2C [Planococcus antarcticus DSM 14505]